MKRSDIDSVHDAETLIPTRKKKTTYSFYIFIRYGTYIRGLLELTIPAAWPITVQERGTAK